MKRIKARVVSLQKHDQQWYIHRHIALFAQSLDRLPDAATVKRDKPQSIPAEMLDMVF